MPCEIVWNELLFTTTFPTLFRIAWGVYGFQIVHAEHFLIVLLYFRSLESASEMLRKISRSLGPRQSSTLFSLFLCVSVIVRLRLQNPLTPVYLHAKLKDLRMSIGLRLAEV